MARSTPKLVMSQPYPSCVYFAQVFPGGPIKIGYSANLPLRFAQMQRDSGPTTNVLGLTRGDLWEESRLHALFAEHRWFLEWFRPQPDLMGHIERETVKPQFVPKHLAFDRAILCMKDSGYIAGDVMRYLGLSLFDFQRLVEMAFGMKGPTSNDQRFTFVQFEAIREAIATEQVILT